MGTLFNKNISLFCDATKNQMNRVIKSAKIILGISIIGMLVINNLIFLHAHKLANGYVIIHAHPFNKSKDSAPFKMHHHSNAEFFLLHHVQLFFYIGSFILGAKFVLKPIFTYDYCAPSFINSFTYNFTKRGPPAIS